MSAQPEPKIDFGPGTLEDARTRLGITNREVWESLGIGATTWHRWKRTGEVPVKRLTDIVMFLDLDEPAGLPDDVPRSAWQLRSELRRQNDLIAGVLERLEQLESRLPPQDG